MMYNTVVHADEILCMREGELLRLTACGNNAIRFQAFPGGTVIDTDYNLMPQSVAAETCEGEHAVSLRCGTLTATIDERGDVSFTKGGQTLLAEKPEHTFGSRCAGQGGQPDQRTGAQTNRKNDQGR